jgi:hypothetical protein
MDIVDMAIHSIVCQKSDCHGNGDFKNSQKLDSTKTSQKIFRSKYVKKISKTFWYKKLIHGALQK